MSADNWATCPKCLRTAAAEKEARHRTAAEAYGKVPADEWRALVAEAEAEPELEDTLREDYSVGMTVTGRFYVSYRGRCQRCDFEHRFKAEEQVLKPGGDPA